MSYFIFFTIYLVLGVLLSLCFTSAGNHIEKMIKSEYENRRVDEKHKVSFRLLVGSWVTIGILLTLAVNLCIVFDKADKELQDRIEVLEQTVSKMSQENTIALDELPASPEE